MKEIKNTLKVSLALVILVAIFSFSKLNFLVDSIKIVKKNNNTYMYLTQSINFSLNKVYINENCKPQLHLIVHHLKKHPKLKIEVGVHNDLRTKEDLSQTRADILKGFFEKYGANSENITAVGYNKSILLHDCRGKNNKCTEKEQQANRRVEIKILNPDILEDYVVVNNSSGAIIVTNNDESSFNEEEVVMKKETIKKETKSPENKSIEGKNEEEVIMETESIKKEVKPSESKDIEDKKEEE